MSINATMLRHGLQIATIVTVVASGAAKAEGNSGGDQARVRAAVAYLDARQEAWSKFAKAERGEGADKTTCVSCHTGISYTLARPSLRKFNADPGPSAREEKIVSAVSLRVEHWEGLDSARFRLMYDSDDRKKAESRGTEAVINALVLARDDATRGRATASTLTRTALRHLWAAQLTSGPHAGSWDWLDFGLAPWEAGGSRAFGASLAALAVGSAPGCLEGSLDEGASRGVDLLRDYVRRRFPEETLYNRLWILEASTKFEGLLSPEEKREVVEQLLALQREDGGWALAPLGGFQRVDGTAQDEDSDGYATALAIHSLLRAGLPSARPELAKGLIWLRSHQREDGSWPGRSVNKERDPSTFVGKLMSDAATALAAQALVESESK